MKVYKINSLEDLRQKGQLPEGKYEVDYLSQINTTETDIATALSNFNSKHKAKLIDESAQQIIYFTPIHKYVELELPSRCYNVDMKLEIPLPQNVTFQSHFNLVRDACKKHVYYKIKVACGIEDVDTIGKWLFGNPTHYKPNCIIKLENEILHIHIPKDILYIEKMIRDSLC